MEGPGCPGVSAPSKTKRVDGDRMKKNTVKSVKEEGRHFAVGIIGK